ncbi:hypothetical protein [Mesorhizobium sp. WSM2239]|uniref:Phage tail protein n=2 Tax=unclassified Mesorhizobium TaxID=325217 RepID=A0AAU8D238_9HYPH
MTPQLIYVETANLYVLLVGNKIGQIQTNVDPGINPHAVRVESLDATTDRTNVHIADRNVYLDKSKLYLDAADITTFAAWLYGQMPDASTNAFGKAMFGYFAGSMNFTDVMVAAGRAAGVPGMRQAQGEELYFMGRARESDPEGFTEMAAAYAASATPKAVE